MRNSLTHPLRIVSLLPPVGTGRIGVTLCPGKKDAQAAKGPWDRDLAIDIDAIAAWGAEVVVTLIEPQEMVLLQVELLPETVARRGMRWVHLPVRDGAAPGADFEIRWTEIGLAAILKGGGSLLVHCRGGLGRAGLVAARLLVELGLDPAEAMRRVRAERPGAIETAEQEAYVLRCIGGSGDPMP